MLFNKIYRRFATNIFQENAIFKLKYAFFWDAIYANFEK